MKYSVVIEPQEGQTYEEILAVARRAESLGFDGFYRSDHYASVWRGDERGSTDAWATLAGLARETRRIAIGTMVSPATFRPASNLAMIASTVAQMAGTVDGAARVHVGLGTGWLESEHRMFGFPFDDVASRFRRLEEHARIVRGLWGSNGAPFDFDGEFEQLTGAIFLPAPDPAPHVVVGGNGRVKTVRLAAEFADEMNTPWATPDDVGELRGLLDAACGRVRRPPIPLTVTAACLVGESDADLERRCRELHAEIGEGEFDAWIDERRSTWAIGTPDQVARHVRDLAVAGAAGFTFMHLLPHDLDMLDVIAREVLPRIEVT
jgi:alkanesulfonate monooxygenase SsuD/methylene tetrahydromethanopterin reductase-like flavin-dependent oxidoreductase (luciferase family)